MNRVRNRNEGYTIVETIIFLAVTGVLFSSTISLINGQQARAEFQNAVKDVQTQIQDIANDVATGYYNNPATLKCNRTGGVPRITSSPGVNTQGENQDCIFIGRAIQFGPIIAGGGPERMKAYNIAGLRVDSSGKEVVNYTDAKPTALARGNTTNNTTPDDAVQTLNLSGGIEAGYVRYVHNSAPPVNVSGIAFMFSLAQYNLGVIASGAQSLNLLPVGTPTAPSPKPGLQDTAFVDALNGISSASPTNPNGGFQICFNSGSTNQHAIITLGKNKRLTTHVQILSGPCV